MAHIGNDRDSSRTDRESVSLQRQRRRVPKACDVLADELRNRIVAGGLQLGDDLPSEGELISETGFSRGTVREALRLLETDGLISIQRGPRGGVSVARPDHRQVTHSLALLLALSAAPLSELFEFRRLLEPAAASLAATSATPEQRRLLTSMAEPDESDFIGHNVEFHIVLAEATGNEFFKVVLTAMHELTEWHAATEGIDPTDLRAAQSAHERIAKHIVAGQAQAAARAVSTHIDRFEEIMQKKGRLEQPIILRSSWGPELVGRNGTRRG